MAALYHTRSARYGFWKMEWCAGAWLSGACVLVADSAIRRGLLLHSSLNHDKKSEGAAEITMSTKIPHPVDKHVGSRVRMRRLMLDMSQEKLGNELGITFQQVQKYEKGTNRISAGRLQAMSHILQVPVPFFFEGAPQIAGHVGKGAAAPSPAYVSDFLAHADGSKLARAFTEISDAKLKRSLVRLVEKVGGESDD